MQKRMLTLSVMPSGVFKLQSTEQQNFFVQDDSPKPEETTMMPAAEEKGFTPQPAPLPAEMPATSVYPSL